MKTLPRISTRGASLAEVMITLGVVAIVGCMVFLILNSGMVLYAKNTAVNSAHQQARAGVDEMLQNIHASVSIPQLTDSGLVPLAGSATGPAAGIAFQVFNAGPFPVVADAGATSTSLTLYCPSFTPPANSRLNIPSHNIELDISSSSVSGTNRVFNFAQAIGTAVDIAGTGIEGGSGTTYVIWAFITTRVAYAVVGSELRYYPTNGYTGGVFDPTNSATYKVVTRNITSTTPFTVPTLPGGTPDNRYLAAVDLSSAEPTFSQRGYAAVNMFLSAQIPFRCRLTNLQ